MGAGEAGSEQPQVIDVRGQGLAVALEAGDRLNLRFCQVHLDCRVVFLGQVAAAMDEFITAMERNGRTERRADLVAVERPVVQQVATNRQMLLVGRREHAYRRTEHFKSMELARL